jgi:putative ABC transport system ATP-binding protein
MLEVKGLQFQYDGQTQLHFPDFRCATGEHWLLLGQSGTGKTTLLHLLGGLLTPPTGSIQVGDTDITRLQRAQLDAFRGQHIGIIFQKPHFVRSLHVSDNLALAQKLAGVPVDRNRIQELLDHLNVGNKAQKYPDQLSQGEQQRVAIARALVNRPTVILADEPTSALDDDNAQEVIQLLEREANEVNATLLVVTHDRRLTDHFPKQIRLA